jgi:hypothetical protein
LLVCTIAPFFPSSGKHSRSSPWWGQGYSAQSGVERKLTFYVQVPATGPERYDWHPVARLVDSNEASGQYRFELDQSAVEFTPPELKFVEELGESLSLFRTQSLEEIISRACCNHPPSDRKTVTTFSLRIE